MTDASRNPPTPGVIDPTHRHRLNDTSLEFDRLLAELADRIGDRVAERLAEQLPQTQPVDELQDEPATAELLKVSQQTLQRMRKSGAVPFVRLGRRVLYRPTDVLAALSAQEKGGAA